VPIHNILVVVMDWTGRVDSEWTRSFTRH